MRYDASYMDASSRFAGKKITVTGLGLLGRGVGDIRYLAECGADLIVTDLKSAEELAPSLAELSAYPSIRYTLGRHDLEDFRNRDLIIKGPKTPQDSVYIAEAEKNGIPVTMSTALFAKYAREEGATLVGITGTRGKSTTTEMIAHVLKTAGKKVLLGGNIRGVSTLALLPDVTADTIAVLELDSWQLQGFGLEKISPDVAVFTNLMPDHQDYYGSMDAYLADKAEIFIHQSSEDTLVLGEEIAKLLSGHEEYKEAAARATVTREEDSPALSVLGDHNRRNAACARAACERLGVDEQVIDEALLGFGGVPGRLELIATKDGIRFYNDTNATTPDATLAALSALEGEGDLVLIMGGSDKGLDMGKLLVEVPKRVKRLIMLPGSGTDRVLEFLPGASVFDSMSSAVREAARSASPGDIVLLSPAFASFGTFKNEYDRGDQYAAHVEAFG